MVSRRPLVNISGTLQEIPAGDSLPLDLSGRVPVVTSKSGAYIWGSLAAAVSAILGNGNLRVCPLWLPSAVGVTAIGTEFTVAGDAASVLRMAIFNDDGSGYPGTLALDGGSISTGTGNAGTVATAGTPGVYMNTLGATTSLAAGLYWIGGAVQGVVTTQPTMRVSQFQVFNGSSNAVPGAASNSFGYSNSGITSTLPNPFTTFVNNISGIFPRIILRLS
jgi:hypothetical protein